MITAYNDTGRDYILIEVTLPDGKKIDIPVGGKNIPYCLYSGQDNITIRIK